jgi:hypothetical protein
MDAVSYDISVQNGDFEMIGRFGGEKVATSRDFSLQKLSVCSVQRF